MNLKTLAEFERKILINVWELYEEAKLLQQHGHFARAYTLAHLSFEENAKITVLTYLAMDIFAGKNITSVSIHDLFTSQLFKKHTNKLRIAYLKLPNYDFQTTVEQIRALNIFKNKSLYADILDGEMFKPSDFFGRDQSELMIDLAKNTLQTRIEELGGRDLKEIGSISEETIENYYKEMKEVFDTSQTFQQPDREIDYIDLLTEIIKNEEKYNRLKQLY